MPAPIAMMMKTDARLKFSGNNLKVPDGWVTPSGDPGAKHWGQAFKASEKSTTPDPTVPPLFTPHTLVKHHTDTQKKLTQIFGGFIDGISDAICSAWGQWQSMAVLTGVVINGPVASVGQVVGPPLTPLIMASGPKSSPSELKYTTAVANTVGTCWLAYTATIKVPGLPWYPAFTAFPSPVAPPTPNIPTPVIALTQNADLFSSQKLKDMMCSMLADPKAQYHKELFDSIAFAIQKNFLQWQATTMITNVLGTGPIPTFAPPVVPVGPVVGGLGNMIPGGFT
jgi:hypothetical protein